MTRRENPWKAASLAIALGVPLGVIGTVVEQQVDRSVASSRSLAASSRAAAPAHVVEECNRLAAQAPRDRVRIPREAVVSGPFGQPLGVTGGALFGLSEANRKSEYAVTAYRHCMSRRGWY